MEEARSDFLRQIGFPYESLEKKGIISPNVNVTCNYYSSTRYPEIIQIKIGIIKIGYAELMHNYTMTVNNKIVCKGTSKHCFVDKNKSIINIKQRLPKFYSKLLKIKCNNFE